MIRGIVYSLVAICIFLTGSILWMVSGGIPEEVFPLVTGWTLLISLFAVGPFFFTLGYWHHRRLFPDEPHWDPEAGE